MNDEYGGIDGVHFNAMDMSAATLGVDGQHDLLTLPLEAWQRTIDVGLTGFLLAARYSIPVMLERGGGKSSIRSVKSVYYMVKVLLAIFVGLLRRRPVPEPGDEAPVAASHAL